MQLNREQRRAKVNPLALLESKKRLDEDQSRDLSIAYRLSLQSMLYGHGTEQAWSTVTCALNISLTLAKYGVGADCMATIDAALDAMVSVRNRAKTGKAWAFTGDELKPVLAALEIHDWQNQNATTGQMQTALEEVHRKVMGKEEL